MDEVVEGINEENLSILIFETLDYADRISEIFEKIDQCIDKLSNKMSSDSCTKLINYYNELRTNYSVVKNNIISYSDDFMCLIKMMQDNDKAITSLFKNYTEETKDVIKSIDNGR